MDVIYDDNTDVGRVLQDTITKICLRVLTDNVGRVKQCWCAGYTEDIEMYRYSIYICCRDVVKHFLGVKRTNLCRALDSVRSLSQGGFFFYPFNQFYCLICSDLSPVAYTFYSIKRKD